MPRRKKRRAKPDQRNTIKSAKRHTLLSRDELLSELRRRQVSEIGTKRYRAKRIVRDNVVPISKKKWRHRLKITYPAVFGLNKLRPVARVKTVRKYASMTPDQRMVCVRRAMRRAVMFSIRKAGRGIGGPKKRRLRPDSKVRC